MKFIIIGQLVLLFSKNKYQMQKLISCPDKQEIILLLSHPEEDANYSCRNLESRARTVKSGHKR